MLWEWIWALGVDQVVLGALRVHPGALGVDLDALVVALGALGMDLGWVCVL